MENLGFQVNMKTTLNMIFSVTYYMELHNFITVYCESHFLQTKVESIVWTP
jgi:hypothetical protein